MKKYAKLRGRILEKYRNMDAFAVALGLSVSTLYAKLQDRTEWKKGEIARACELLGIPLTEVSIYFFNG